MQLRIYTALALAAGLLVGGLSLNPAVRAQTVSVLNFFDSTTGTDNVLNINGTWEIGDVSVDATAAEIDKLDGLAATGYLPLTDGCSFTEAGGTTYTCTVTLPAGAFIHNIQFVTTALWDDGTSASLDIGDADDADGWFTSVNVKATDLLVGEVLDISNAENWGGANGAYLVAATGRKGQAIAAYSGIYTANASEVIGVVTTGAQNGSAGRSVMVVTYTVPTLTAATGA